LGEPGVVNPSRGREVSGSPSVSYPRQPPGATRDTEADAHRSPGFGLAVTIVARSSSVSLAFVQADEIECDGWGAVVIAVGPGRPQTTGDSAELAMPSQGDRFSINRMQVAPHQPIMSLPVAPGVGRGMEARE